MLREEILAENPVKEQLYLILARVREMYPLKTMEGGALMKSLNDREVEAAFKQVFQDLMLHYESTISLLSTIIESFPQSPEQIRQTIKEYQT